MEMFVYLFTRTILLACLVVVVYTANPLSIFSGRSEE
jgi:hypothetical protein